MSHPTPYRDAVMKKPDQSLTNFFASGPTSSLPASAKPNEPLNPDPRMNPGQYTEIKDILSTMSSEIQRIQINMQENSKNSEINALKQQVKILSKAHNITTSPSNHSLSLHSIPTSPELHIIGCSMHLPDASPWIHINHETWHYRLSHAEAIMSSTGSYSAVINVQQLPCREFKGKTIYPMNLQFHSILQRDLAARHMISNAKVAPVSAVIQHSLQGFPDLKRSTKWISRILSNKKREGIIANYKIDNFATTGPENNFLAPLYSIQLLKGRKWSKGGDCNSYTTELINNGLSFDQNEDGKSEIYEQFKTRIDEHIKHLHTSDLDKQQMPKSNPEKPNDADPVTQLTNDMYGKGKRKHSTGGYGPTTKKVIHHLQHHSNIQLTSPLSLVTPLPTAPPLQQQQVPHVVPLPTAPILQQQQVPQAAPLPTAPTQQQQQTQQVALPTTTPQQQQIPHNTISRVQNNMLPTVPQPQLQPHIPNYATQQIQQQLSAPASQLYMNHHVPAAQLHQHHQTSQQHQPFYNDNYMQRNPS